MSFIEYTDAPTYAEPYSGIYSAKEFLTVRLTIELDLIKGMFIKDQLQCPTWLKQWAAKWLE